MSRVTVGLSEEEGKLYYVDPKVVVIEYPHDGGPVVILRHTGSPSKEDWEDIRTALFLCQMELEGTSIVREDGLWCSSIKERKEAE